MARDQLGGLMSAANLRLAQAAMGKPETKVGELCREFGISRQTLYRHVGPDGALREDGRKLLERRRR
jgi:hypothetical protein